MQEIKLAFYIGNRKKNHKATLLDAVICLLTKSDYSHVELIYHLDYSNMHAKAWSASPIDGGVRSTTIRLNPDHWDVFVLRGEFVTDRLHEWFEQHNGKKYDWLGAVGVRFPVFRQDRNKWFCTEIISTYLGVKRPRRMSPIRLRRYFGARLEPVNIRVPIYS